MNVLMLGDYPRRDETATGGPQVATARLVRALTRNGVQITVVAPARGRFAESASALDGVERIEIPADQKWGLLTGSRTLRRNFRNVLSGLNADLVHAQETVPYGFAAAEAIGIPRVITAHGNMREDTLAEHKGVGGVVRAYLRERLAKKAIEQASFVVGVNPDWSVNLPARPRRFTYIPNIVPDDFYELDRRPQRAFALFLGGTRAIKGWPVLATAWPIVRAAVDSAQLHVVGWPADAHRAIPQQLGESVSFEGSASSGRVARLMSRASLVVVPSDFEVSPVVVAEAWASKLPVIATRVGGLATYADGAAVLVPRREPPALAQAIVSVFRGTTDVTKLIEEGRRRAQLHRAEAVARAHLTVYEELMASAARST